VRIVYFTHSLSSCWNHGNAHFLRGVMRALAAEGHQVEAWEPAEAWSLANLLRDHGAEGLSAFAEAYPDLPVPHRHAGPEDVCPALDRADLVIVHEWSEPWLVAALGRARRRGGRFTLLFHDTHHRAVSDPEAIRAFDLDGYDGVLAFGEALAEVYRSWGWGSRVFVWHEAADTRLFRPPPEDAGPREERLVWIGNWGDEERSAELQEFLLRPAQGLGLRLDVHGVRYPEAALRALAEHGARYRGWLPNPRVPEVFARNLATVHVPRRFYAERLPGIPTIRVFEALACAIPIVSAPWEDSEGLFRRDTDFLMARDGAQMARHLRALREDAGLRASLAAHGLETIRARHTCAHRAEELTAILGTLRTAAAPAPLEAHA
jgi:spore maturation protein CgeB